MFGAIGGFTTLIIITVIILFILSTCIRIVPQVQALVMERLGAYLGTYGVGIHSLVPLINRVIKKVNLKEQVGGSPPQPAITKDNITMQIGTIVFFYITGPKLYAYSVECLLLAIENLTITTPRNTTGDLKLDETLASKKTINAKMQESLDIAAGPWGVKATRIEPKSTIPPVTIQEAMEKQMKTERERRESILRAEGEKKSMTLVAEGNKESAVLNTEAKKETAILRVRVEKEEKIKETQGWAEAIRSVQKVTADGIRFVKEAGANNAVLQLKSLEAFQAAANGKANRIVIPSDTQGVAGLAKSIAEAATKDKATK